MSCSGLILSAVCALTAPDKVGHYASGATLAAVVSIAATPEWGMTAAVGAAIGKEYWDSKGHGNVEMTDALATALGGALVFAALKTERFRLSMSPNGTPVLAMVGAF